VKDYNWDKPSENAQVDKLKHVNEKILEPTLASIEVIT